MSRASADDHPAFVVALESASTITSTVAPCLSLLFSPGLVGQCIFDSNFPIQVLGVMDVYFGVFSCPAPSGLIIFFTVPGTFFLHLLVRSNPPRDSGVAVRSSGGIFRRWRRLTISRHFSLVW